MKKTLLTVLLIGVLVTMLISVPRNKVIVEIGTGTWCTYCPGAAMGADDLVDNGHPVAIIENHNGDTYANAYSNARNTYYNITGYPTANFDGGNASVGGSHTASMYNNYLPRVNARVAVPSHFNINAGGGAVGNVYNITATIDKTEADTNTNLKFHCVVTESNINQSWQGQTHLNFVTRLMAPDQNGTTVDFGAGTSVTIPLTFTMNPAWVVNNCELVLFLQNNTTKEILQGAKYTLTEIGGAFPVSLDEINFPDTYLTGTATVPMIITNYWNITATGSIVSNNPVFGVSQNRLDFTIPPYQARTYNVTFTPTAVGAQTGNLTITTNMPDYATINIPMTGTGFTNAAPNVTNVTVSGIPVVSMMMTGDYDFSDPDNNQEGASTLQWYRINGTTPTPITDANGLTYTLQPADIGFQIGFEVTPRDQHGMPGTPVMSPASPTIEVLPAPQNLTYAVTNEVNVTLNWERPEHFNTRAFVGYRVYRDDLVISNITNINTTTFTDTWLMNGDYQYWVCSIFSNPLAYSEPSNVVNVHIGPTSNDDNTTAIISAMDVYPNPFNSITNVVVSSKANAPVQAKVFNTKGQLVSTLQGVTNTSGIANLKLENTAAMESGIYFVTVKSSDKSLTKKVILVK